MEIIDREGSLPFYQQLYDILRKGIVNGRWLPGDTMPSEAELIEQYQISRITVRQAFAMLVKDGLVYRRRGRGTFVAVPKIAQGLERMISFTEDMRRRGLHPGTEILAAEVCPATAEIAQKLEILPGEEIAILERLRLADGEPLSVEIAHLIHRDCPGVLDGDFANNPLSEALIHQYGIRLVRARQVIRAVAAPDKLARKLSVPPKAPLFYIERVSYSQRERPVEFLQMYHRGDRYALYNELRS